MEQEFNVDSFVEAIAKLSKESKHSILFDELADHYLRIHASNKKSGRKDKGYMRRELLPNFGGKQIHEITKVDILTWFNGFGQGRSKPVAANRAFQILKKMFNLAIEWGYFPGPNPCHGIKQFKEKARKRFLTKEEIKRLTLILNTKSPVVQAAFKTILLTGLRKGELLNIRARDVYLDRRLIFVPETKNGEERYVPLPPFEYFQLTANMKPEEYVFKGNANNGRLNADKEWLKIRKEAELNDVTIHDLRRTFASHLAMQGESLLSIAKALGHKSQRSTEVYAHLQMQQTIDAVGRLTKNLNELIE